MYKILIIDDEKSIADIMAISLKSDGYEVFTAYNGNDSIEILKKEQPHIVITDLKMSGMDGLEVLKKAKEINIETEIIISTGHGDMDSAIEALHLGASDFLNKPIRDDILSVALERAKVKIEIRKKLHEYTKDLEYVVEIATEEVKRKSEFQSKLISSSNDAIVGIDDEKRIIIFNPLAEKIFGYTKNEVLEILHATDLHLPEIQEERQKNNKSKSKKNITTWQEVNITNKDGKIVPTRFSGAILYEKGIKIGQVCFFQDLREIKKLQQDLIKSERLAEMGQAVAGLAHYIKNILTGLKGGSYIANIGFENNNMKKLSKGWTMIQKNIGLISDLVLNLLTYSKERKPEYEICNPNEIMDDIYKLLKPVATENKVKIKENFDKSIKQVLMDPQTIHRSLLNLVSNAIDACIFDENISKNHIVTIKTKLEDKNIIQFEIKDNGSGMADETKSKLFTSFYSTKMGKGTGLGLLITKKLVEEHDGEIHFSSKMGKGTTFFVRLPYQTSAKVKKPEANKRMISGGIK